MKLYKSLFLLSLLSISSSLFAKEPLYYSVQKDDHILVNQRNTGKYGDTNCVPTSIYMMYSWLGVYKGTVEDIRLKITSPSNYGGISHEETVSYFIKNEPHLDYTIEEINSKEEFIKIIKNNLALITFDFARLKESKYYGTGKVWGHALLSTGYYNGPEGEFIEVLDPDNITKRYYDLDEIYYAMIPFNNEIIYVAKDAYKDLPNDYVSSLNQLSISYLEELEKPFNSSSGIQ